jgi:hypothetical protein
VTRLADGRQAGLTALEDGRTEYWNELAGELGGPAALLEKVEAWAPLVDARLREGK